MAKIVETRDVPLVDLVIGKGQVRLTNTGKEIDELAASIRVNGLLQPIMICPAEKEGKYEILLGQRRFLAHQELQRDTILASILDERVDETTARILSLTENMVRTKLDKKDLVDVCTSLYKKYGAMIDVARATGLPYDKVRKYVKYDRLEPEMQKLSDENKYDVTLLLRAQDAASVTGEYNPEDAVMLAHEMAGMDSSQQRQVLAEREGNPSEPVDDVLKRAKAGKTTHKVSFKLTGNCYEALNSHASEEDIPVEQAAQDLVIDGLVTRGFIDE